MPTILTKAATDTILSNRKIIDMREKIFELNPSGYPFVTILNHLGKIAATQTKVEWLEDEIFPRLIYTHTNGITGGSTTEAAVLVDDGSGNNVATYLRPYDVLRNADNSENFLVTDIGADTTSNGIDIKMIGSGNLSALAENKKLILIGNALAEGSGAVPYRGLKVTNDYNYTQIFKTTVEETGSLAAVKLYGGDYRSYMRNKKGKEHMTDIERAFLFGIRDLDTSTTGEPRRYTGGLLGGDFITGSSNVASGTFYADFMSYCNSLFTYGSDVKLFFSGAGFITKINSVAEGKLELKVRETEYGVRITRLITPYGDLDIVRHRLLVDDYSEYAIGVDPADVFYRYLGDDGKGVRDHRLETNVQDNDSDSWKDQYLTECCLEIHNDEKHRIAIYTG